MEQAPSLCFFDCLPLEITSTILTLVTMSHPDLESRYTSPSTLCLVSRQWRIIAQGTPEIWTVVYVHNKRTLNHVPVRLQRSGGLPLAVLIEERRYFLTDPWFASVEEMLALLRPSTDRWRALHLKIVEVEPYFSLLPFLLPQLSELSIMNMSSGEAPVLGPIKYPRLKVLTLESFPIFWDPSASIFANLTRFSLSCPGADEPIDVRRLLDHLQNSTSLHELELSSIVFQTVTEDDFSAITQRSITMPDLKKLSLELLDCFEVSIVLQVLHAPAVQTFSLWAESDDEDVETPPSYNWKMTPFLFPALTHLKITDCKLEDEELFHILDQLPPVKSLWLSHILNFDDAPDLDPMNLIFNSIFNDPNLPHLTADLSVLYAMGTNITMLYDGIKALVQRGRKPPIVIINSRDLNCTGLSAQKAEEHRRVARQLADLVTLRGQDEEEIEW